MRTIARLSLTAITTLAAMPAAAQTLTPLAEARLRYESVEQDGLPKDAHAVTTRVRTGVEAKAARFSALFEAQGNLSIVPDYFDGLNGKTDRPLIADPRSIAVYRAQLRYAAPTFAVTAGRQRIALDDERFVGAAQIRNNAQTFDAVRTEWSPIKGVKADVTYAWGVRTVWGIDGTGARQRDIAGDNVFATLGVVTPIGTATAFAYLVDQDEAVVQSYRLSSQSYGLRLAGNQPIGKAKLSYTLSHARQSDWHRNPNDYAASYWLADGAVELTGTKLGAGYEVLGADDGRALTAFNTPLSSIFKFQGWADKFTTTPADGIRDLYANVGHNWPTVGRLKGVGVQAAYHRFASDRLVRRYGDELDLLATAKLDRTALSVRYADYRADGFGVDTRKFWLQLDWTL